MRVLALDLTSHTGWALFDGHVLKDKGLISVDVEDFDVNKHPEKSESYPYNLIDAANRMAGEIAKLYSNLRPDQVVIENTVKGRNRHTQRLLEFIHKATIDALRGERANLSYMDPSEWRAVVELRLSNEDKKNNRLVSAGKRRGRITKKHLSVRMANEIFDLRLKLKDNDIADAICLGLAFVKARVYG